MNRSQTNHSIRSRAAALVVLVFIAGAAAAMAAPTPPNIVFLISDDMGFGDPGCYNPQSKIPTPHMDQLAAGGLRFTDAHSPAAVCTPTRYSVLTGRYCWRRKKSGVLGGYSPPLIENSRPTIASILKKQGYSTLSRTQRAARTLRRGGRPRIRPPQGQGRPPRRPRLVVRLDRRPGR